MKIKITGKHEAARAWTRDEATGVAHAVALRTTEGIKTKCNRGLPPGSVASLRPSEVSAPCDLCKSILLRA